MNLISSYLSLKAWLQNFGIILQKEMGNFSQFCESLADFQVGKGPVYLPQIWPRICLLQTSLVRIKKTGLKCDSKS